MQYLTAQGHLQRSVTFKQKVPPRENGTSNRAGKEKKEDVFKDLKQCVRKREGLLKPLRMFVIFLSCHRVKGRIKYASDMFSIWIIVGRNYYQDFF